MKNPSAELGQRRVKRTRGIHDTEMAERLLVEERSLGQHEMAHTGSTQARHVVYGGRRATLIHHHAERRLNLRSSRQKPDASSHSVEAMRVRKHASYC